MSFGIMKTWYQALNTRYSSYQTATLLLKHLPIWWWISWLSGTHQFNTYI